MQEILLFLTIISASIHTTYANTCSTEDFYLKGDKTVILGELYSAECGNLKKCSIPIVFDKKNDVNKPIKIEKKATTKETISLVCKVLFQNGFEDLVLKIEVLYPPENISCNANSTNLIENEFLEISANTTSNPVSKIKLLDDDLQSIDAQKIENTSTSAQAIFIIKTTRGMSNFKCTAKWPHQERVVSSNVYVKIDYPPDRITCDANTTHLLEDEIVKITAAAISDPAADITLIGSNEQAFKPQKIYSVNSTSTGTFIIKVKRFMSNFVCVARWPYQNKTVSSSVSIKVDYPPEKISCEANTTQLLENETLEITATAISDPVADIKLIGSNKQTFKSQSIYTANFTSSGTFIIKVKRFMANFVCVARWPYQNKIVSSDVSITVDYPPENVQFYGRYSKTEKLIFVVCSAVSSPSATLHIFNYLGTEICSGKQKISCEATYDEIDKVFFKCNISFKTPSTNIEIFRNISKHDISELVVETAGIPFSVYIICGAGTILIVVIAALFIKLMCYKEGKTSRRQHNSVTSYADGAYLFENNEKVKQKNPLSEIFIPEKFSEVTKIFEADSDSEVDHVYSL